MPEMGVAFVVVFLIENIILLSVSLGEFSLADAHDSMNESAVTTLAFPQ